MSPKGGIAGGGGQKGASKREDLERLDMVDQRCEMASTKRSNRGALALLVLTLGLAATGAFAQEEANSEGGVSYQRKTVINFEDDTIEGDLKTPDGQYLESRKKMRHKSLIRIRTDFRREVMSSVADL